VCTKEHIDTIRDLTTGRTKHRKVYVTTTDMRPVPLQHYLLHDFELYQLMSAEKGYMPGALSAVANHQKDKLKPKPMTAENGKFASQRQGEKAAIAAQAAGKNVANQNQIMSKFQGGGGDVSGDKAQWNSLLKILQAGGREAAGGLSAINFGVATSGTVLSGKVRAEKNSLTKYEKLHAELRAKMTKKEYEATEVRGDVDEAEANEDGTVGLLPVVVFSFSEKTCEEIADFLKGQDLLSNREKGRSACY
jgi:superfamily II RNA helicase